MAGEAAPETETAHSGRTTPITATVLLTAETAGDDGAEQRALAQRVRDACRRWGIDASVRTVSARELEGAVRAAVAARSRLVVVGGGDGSISTAAAVLTGAETPLGVLPLGTFNHFARDLGIPVELDNAVQVIARAHVRCVDVGEVNGRVFINNSSIGLYPSAVETRDTQRERFGWSKWPAMVYGSLTVVRRFRLLRVTVRVEGQTRQLITPFLFVGNNEYELSLFTMGRRRRLDGGQLGLYIARTSSRWGVARLVLHTLMGRLNQAEELESFCSSSLEIESNRRDLRVACDGEVMRMAPPLRYRIRPRALQVIAPSVPT
jgi:diacylglycerol kinase family enzyme